MDKKLNKGANMDKKLNKGANMEKQILNWIEQARKSIEASSIAEYPDCKLNHTTLTFKKGKKYYKLITENLYDNERGGSVYSFIDLEGNIYKAASYKAPAKGTRGNIEKVDPTKLGACTGWLYR